MEMTEDREIKMTEERYMTEDWELTFVRVKRYVITLQAHPIHKKTNFFH